MFDNIGDESLFAIDACRFERFIKQTAGWGRQKVCLKDLL
jgi:hypothetical protein